MEEYQVSSFTGNTRATLTSKWDTNARDPYEQFVENDSGSVLELSTSNIAPGCLSLRKPPVGQGHAYCFFVIWAIKWCHGCMSYSPSRHCTCFSLYLGLSSLSLLLGLSSCKPFLPLPPTDPAWSLFWVFLQHFVHGFVTTPLQLPSKRILDLISPWGSHRVKNGDYWSYCPGTKIVPDTEVLSECLWRKSISWAPVFSSWKTKYGKLNEFFMSDFDWWL